MAKEIKFTTDGKKVVVIGNLNSQEKIVQEIFVVDESEIPAGEHFVVKSLLDAPAISYKENELKKLEERYERERKQYYSEIAKNYNSYKAKCNEFRKKMDYIGSALKKADEKSFETLVDYITGEIEWIVISKYSPEIIPISKFNEMYENQLRLISFFGKDDGTFTYAIGEYYDYSGSHKHFIPFKNYDDALAKFKDIVLNSGITDKNLELAKQYEFEFPESDVINYNNSKLTTLTKNIEDYSKKILEWQNAMDELR